MSVPVDPWSAGFQALGAVANSPAMAPGIAKSEAAFASGWDSSGWTVNVGSGSTSATAVKNDPVAGLSAMLQNPVVLFGLLAAFYFMRKK